MLISIAALTWHVIQVTNHRVVLSPGKRQIARIQLLEYRNALRLFMLDGGRYPTGAEGLNALVEDPGVPHWGGPYLPSLKPDPWGNTYHYDAESQGSHYDLWSYGATGRPGGEGQNEDCHVNDQ